jgi:hypothetical protein
MHACMHREFPADQMPEPRPASSNLSIACRIPDFRSLTFRNISHWVNGKIITRIQTRNLPLYSSERVLYIYLVEAFQSVLVWIFGVQSHIIFDTF